MRLEKDWVIWLPVTPSWKHVEDRIVWASSLDMRITVQYRMIQD